MVNLQQIQSGIASYLDNELMPMLPQTGIERVLLGTGLSLLIKKNFNKINDLKEQPLVKAMGIFDEEGNVDLDTLRDEVKANMTNDGIKVEVPMIGGLTFKKDDIDKLYTYITKIGGK